MNKKDIEDKIKELEEVHARKIAELRAELTKPEELKPYNWEGKRAFFSNIHGDVEYTDNPSGRALTYRKTEGGALQLSREMKLTQLIHSLKVSLEDDTDWVDYDHNCFVYFDSHIKRWVFGSSSNHRHLCQVWMSEKTAQKIFKYLNEHHPEGI